MTTRPVDEQHMQRALRLAARGQGAVEPNPMVGCVLVKGGKVIGEGYHRRYGGPHAEINALRSSSDSPRGATAYVTLEPCCHTGKTGPCADALLEAGIARVVAAVQDPNPQVAGRGLAKLRRNSVTTEVGLLAAEADALNAPFFKLITQKRPWVIAKWAQSIDGKIATRRRTPQWLTDETGRQHVHRTRGRLDAIIVGRGTVVSDDPELTCRGTRPRRVATRVVLDRMLRTPAASQLVATARDVPTWIFHAAKAPSLRRRRLAAAGCILRPVRSTRTGLSLPAVLDVLGQADMTNVLVEGGGGVLGSFFDQRLIDEVHIYIARLLLGGAAAPGPLNGVGVQNVAEAPRLPDSTTPRRLGNAWFVAARLGQPWDASPL